MAGKIIMWIVTFGCACLFFGIGMYARTLKKPMWFWSGTEVDPSTISDIKKYNRENGVMWKTYSMWYFLAGVFHIIASVVFFMLGCTAGLVILISTYGRILKNTASAPFNI